MQESDRFIHRVSAPQSHSRAYPPRIRGSGSMAAPDCTGGLAYWGSGCFSFCSSSFQFSGGFGQKLNPHSGRIFPLSGRILPQTGAFLKTARSTRALLEILWALFTLPPWKQHSIAALDMDHALTIKGRMKTWYPHSAAAQVTLSWLQ